MWVSYNPLIIIYFYTHKARQCVSNNISSVIPLFELSNRKILFKEKRTYY